MNVPRIDQITVSVDIAHLHVSGFILHAGARDRQHSEWATDGVAVPDTSEAGVNPLTTWWARRTLEGSRPRRAS